MSDDFYKQFEDRFRGSRDLILTRLRVYLDFLQPLKTIHLDGTVLDLGCGRGEWLELVQEEGFNALGVDLDESMLLAAKKQGMHVVQEDAIEFLIKQEANSRLLISAFHFVEHIPDETLKQLVKEAYRVLKPGGLLIMETPNPESLLVGTKNFYLDPTHISPIPPEYLHFIPSYFGFSRSKILRVNEPFDLKHKNYITFGELYGGVSPDYAVVAQKGGCKQSDGVLNAAFNKTYGVSLNDLIDQFDSQYLSAYTTVKETSCRLQEENRELQGTIAELKNAINQSAVNDLVIQEKLEKAELLLQSTDRKVQRATALCNSLLNSRLWQAVSFPRLTNRLMNLLVIRSKNWLKAKLRPGIDRKIKS